MLGQSSSKGAICSYVSSTVGVPMIHPPMNLPLSFVMKCFKVSPLVLGFLSLPKRKNSRKSSSVKRSDWTIVSANSNTRSLIESKVMVKRSNVNGNERDGFKRLIRTTQSRSTSADKKRLHRILSRMYSSRSAKACFDSIP